MRIIHNDIAGYVVANTNNMFTGEMRNQGNIEVSNMCAKSNSLTDRVSIFYTRETRDVLILP